MRGIRELIEHALPKDLAVFAQTPDLRNTFIPAGHSRALHPDAVLVVGIRGAGKSFWWKVLQSEEHRRMVEHLMPRSGIRGTTKVSLGFGQDPSPMDYPGQDTLAELIGKYDPRQVWRTIVLRQIIKNTDSDHSVPKDGWLESVAWLAAHPEEVEQKLYKADKDLEKEGEYHLVLFDALDRAAGDWPNMLEIIKGLLQVLLEFRSYRRIRPKAFVRPDHLEDSRTVAFPDSSKLLSQKVDLRWPRNELYGLLWQYLANDKRGGERFRKGCESEILGLEWKEYKKGIWTVPERLRIEEESQREVFHAITGPYMGRDRRRGFPYTWLPNHLGDGREQVSPRSFLAALSYAAEADRPRKEYKYSLYYESIKEGAQRASKIRVEEMQEDYPWVAVLMGPLNGLTVPCHFKDIVQRWREHKILDRLEEDKKLKLPPTYSKKGDEGLRKDLEELGVFSGMKDGRVNMPDVYRVGFGLGRKGGVKAVASKLE